MSTSTGAPYDDPFGGAGGAAISWKDAAPGTKYVITVTERPSVLDGTDFNGDPQEKIVVNGDVDGEARSLWMPKVGVLARAIREAQQKAGEVIEPGGVLTVWTDGLKPSPNDPKREFRTFGASYQPPKHDAFAASGAGAAKSDEPPF